MAGDARTDYGLRLVAQETAAFIADIEGLSADAWQRPTNCPPWSVRELVAHLTRGAEAYVAAIEAGLRGELAPFQSREERQRRTEEIMAMDVHEIVSLFRANADRVADTFGGLGEAQVDTLGVHSTGPRTARWWVDQRLAELAFHRWDLERSLGLERELDREIAEHLLVTLMDENFVPIASRGGLGGEGRFRLVERGGAGAAWTVISSNGFVGVSRRSGAPVDATLEGEAAALCLLVYGRRTAGELSRAGRLNISGNRTPAERFGEIFKGP
jgi:uncharacterized protein (TIGR03083 family)